MQSKKKTHKKAQKITKSPKNPWNKTYSFGSKIKTRFLYARENIVKKPFFLLNRITNKKE